MRFCNGCIMLDKRLKNPCKKGYAVKEGKTDYIRPSACKVKPKKSKLDTTSGLNDALDKAWSLAVRQKGFCEHCFEILPLKKLQAHHIFSRRHFSTRWDLNNGVSLCWQCHIQWAHKDIMECAEWITSVKGQANIDALRIKANTAKQFTDEEKKAILKNLKDFIDIVE